AVSADVPLPRKPAPVPSGWGALTLAARCARMLLWVTAHLCKLPSVSGISSTGAANCPLLDGLIGRRPDAAPTSVQPCGRHLRCARFRRGRAAPCARAGQCDGRLSVKQRSAQLPLHPADRAAEPALRDPPAAAPP